MKKIGLLAEYNPFHRGHAWQLEKIREAFGQDCCITAVMSGCFVQRGEPALFDKHARARAALACGADLVLELPLPWAMASAGDFARGGVKLLHALGSVDCLCFGSESGDLARLRQLAALLRRPELDSLIREELERGAGYALARQRAAQRLSGEALPELERRNDILALEYLLALEGCGSSMEPVAIPRSGDFAPASSLRRRPDFLSHLPEAAAEVFREEARQGRGPVRMESLEGAILARLRCLEEEDWARVPDATEGLEKRLMRLCRSACSMEQLVREATTKRYPAARVRRMLMAAFLGLEGGLARQDPGYLRLLAMNGRGRELLRQAEPTLPVITKPARGKDDPVFRLEARACGLYALGFPDRVQRAGDRDWKQTPFIADGD